MIRQIVLKFLRSLTGWPPLAMPFDEKIDLLRSMAKLRPGAILVETGTFQGEAVEALRGDFQKLITIELFEPLYSAAREKFRDDSKIEPHHGDSASLLPGILQNIASPIVYWLDGHYSGPGTGGKNICPVLAELDAIFTRNNPQDIILIDDARLFGWQRGFPSKKNIGEQVASRRPGAVMKLVKDVFVIALPDAVAEMIEVRSVSATV